MGIAIGFEGIEPRTFDFHIRLQVGSRPG
jgi:hypothetical protein